MASPVASPVQKYLNDVAAYYNLNQQAQAQQPAAAGLPINAGINLIPAIVPSFGGGFGGGGNGGVGINVLGGVGDLQQVRDYQQQDQANTRANNASWIGAILTILGAAGLACVCSKWNQSSERLEDACQFRDTQLPLVADLGEKAQLTQIVNKDIQILEKETSRIRNIVILSTVAVASALTAFIAGMFSVQWLITVAVIVGVATLAVGAFAAVYYCMQKSETPTGVVEFLQAQQYA